MHLHCSPNCDEFRHHYATFVAAHYNGNSTGRLQKEAEQKFMSGVPFRLGGVSIYYGSAAHLVPWSGTLSRDPRFFQRAPPTPSVRDIGFVNTMSRCPGFADTMTHGAV